ncbi:UrcA family protein [Novosphingobium sp. 1949]|uniref:UrcA family protein n=1 Tax=Novosphingobium organovorum TaxID=2930092 RepID=A0ABT0BAZ9_9SPHN|nr:UrcA family protein [Novosphingobium organovorum]MCJ2182231.1 UrcA family protein [Novosphingobium organovorum]
MFTKTAFFAAALIGPAAMAGLAATSTPAAAKDVTVYYTDLDLGTQEGQDILHKRLVKAARRACDMDSPTTGTRLPAPSARSCFRQATGKVEDQIAAATRDQTEYARFGG